MTSTPLPCNDFFIEAGHILLTASQARRYHCFPIMVCH